MNTEKLKLFDTEFCMAYEWLYEYGDETPACRAAVKDFDSRMEDHESTFYKAACDYIKFRQDFISSDREAAAFMIAYRIIFAA